MVETGFIKLGKVAVEKAVYRFDQLFDYQIPPELKVQPGCRVLVPFGGGNRKRQGLVLDIAKGDPSESYKQIEELLDPEPLLDEEGMRLLYYLRETTFCTYYDALKVLIPAGIGMRIHFQYTITAPLSSPLSEEALSMLGEEEKRLYRFLQSRGKRGARWEELRRELGLKGLEADCQPLRHLLEQEKISRQETAKRRVQDETVTMVRLCREPALSQGKKLTDKQEKVFRFLQKHQEVSLKELTYLCAVTKAVVSALVAKGLAEYGEQTVYRNPYAQAAIKDRERPALSLEQQEAADSLLSLWKKGEPAVSLLYGVTGSGKTEVYMWLADQVLAGGKNVLVMVPEIALTPQTLGKFHSRYGKQVAVLHSGLSLSQRMDEWKRIREGEVRIVVGTRSAVFAPLKNLGLVVMDEEQEHTYKSDSAPRFHAREAAKFRCRYYKALLVLVSATPSVESYYHALKGHYHLCTLPQRFSGAQLPEVSIVDMNQESFQAQQSGLSGKLLQELGENLKQGEQSILLLNRRGYSTVVKCSECETVALCPHCSISLTYHAKNGQLICHYCGYTKDAISACEACSSPYVRYLGLGTQKAEEKLRELFPSARILRMDTDTTTTRFSHETFFEEFGQGKYDILLGTQMVAKGLDFPNVTLVGVLSADMYLYNEDFRSYERTFDLLTQVVGRSGRGEKKGRACIQTLSPLHEIIALSAKQDFQNFYRQEIAARQLLLYPPFCELCTLGFSGERQEEVKQGAEIFVEMLKDLVKREYSDLPLKGMGPCESGVLKVNNQYRYKILLKYRGSRRFRELISRLLVEFGKERIAGKLRYYADPFFDGIL